jgi:hypothetical protein
MDVFGPQFTAFLSEVRERPAFHSEVQIRPMAKVNGSNFTLESWPTVSAIAWSVPNAAPDI